jgi:hypothetical protein
MGIAYNPQAVIDGLVFCFDAGNIKSYTGTGTTVRNIISGSTGSTINSPAYSTTLGGYFSFVTDDVIAFPEEAALNSQDVTVEVWARTNALGQNGFFFEKGQVNTQYSLFQEGNNIIWRANFGAGLVNMVSILSTSFLNTTNWFQIVATHRTGTQNVYINSVNVGTGTSSGTIATNANGMSIGAYGGFNGGRSYYYNGDISVVKVYNRRLEPDEVRQNFAALRGRYNI